MFSSQERKQYLCNSKKVVADTMVGIILQLINILDQYNAHLKHTQCYESITSQKKLGKYILLHMNGQYPNSCSKTFQFANAAVWSILKHFPFQKRVNKKKRQLYSHFQCGIVHHSQDRETTQVSITR